MASSGAWQREGAVDGSRCGGVGGMLNVAQQRPNSGCCDEVQATGPRWQCARCEDPSEIPPTRGPTRVHARADCGEIQEAPAGCGDGGSLVENVRGALCGPYAVGRLKPAGRRVEVVGRLPRERAAVWVLFALSLTTLCSIVSGMQNGGTLVLSDGAKAGPMSSPAYANSFETWNSPSSRTSSSPVTFRLQAETKFGWEVCVTGGCEALGYWNPEKALLLRTDPSRYPIWEGVGQLPGGCDIEYKYLMRPRGRPDGAKWEDCPNRSIRTTTIEKAILLVTDPDKMTQEELSRQEMVTSQYFKEWTTLAAPFSSTLIFNTARPPDDFKELLEDEAFQRPCALVFCR